MEAILHAGRRCSASATRLPEWSDFSGPGNRKHWLLLPWSGVLLMQVRAACKPLVFEPVAEICLVREEEGID